MKDFLGLSLSSFKKLNSYNSTKDSLINVHTHLRNRHFETSKGEQASGSELGRHKGKTAQRSHGQRLGAPCRSQPKDLHFLQLRGAKRFSEHSCRSGQCELAAQPRDLGRGKGQRYGHGCLVIGISDRETKSQSLVAFP